MRAHSLRWMLTGFVCASLVACAPSSYPSSTTDSAPMEAGLAPRGFVFQTNTLNGESMPYVVHVPRNYTPGKQWPAIMFLHGSGESGTDGHKQVAQGIGTNILWNAARWPAIVIMPQKPSSRRLWDTHAEQVMGILHDVRQQYAIDPQRIALTGLSQGGHGTWTIAAKHPDTWCALAPICGFSDSNGGSTAAESIAQAVKHIPIWCFHGDADDVVKPEQTTRIAELIKQHGGNIRTSIYPGVNHGSWDRAYAEPDLPTFLMQPRKPATLKP